MQIRRIKYFEWLERCKCINAEEIQLVIVYHSKSTVTEEIYCKGLDVVHILDYSYMKENVYKFANAHIRGKNAKGIWAAEICDLIKEGKVQKALETAEEYKDKKQPGIPNIYTYLINNQDCINYPEYVAAGYFIGSDAIESGNKSTMQVRMKLPGMRWEITSAQYVLSAKMKYDSGQWNSDVVPLLYRKLGLTQR